MEVIGIYVDPYYLTHKAQMLNHNPKVILAGRSMNDSMSQKIGKRIIKELNQRKIQIDAAKVLILGVTFKENCPDIRNSKGIGINNLPIKKIKNISVCDMHASKSELKKEHQISLLRTVPTTKKFECILILSNIKNSSHYL